MMPSTKIALLSTCLALGVWSSPAMAQTVGGSSEAPDVALQLPSDAANAQDEDGERSSESRRSRGRGGRARPVVDVAPYIEVGQIVSADLTAGDVFTYSTAAVGVDANVATARTQLGANLRYERRIGWGDRIADQDVLSGLVRARQDIMQGFSLEGGALATRASIDGRGAGNGLLTANRDNSADLYAVYVGPTFGRRIGDFDVGLAYRYGYSRAEIAVPSLLPAGAPVVGRFDDATNHAMIGSIGMRPGTSGLPFGWIVSAGAEREDAGQLNQRYTGRHVRLDVTAPITDTVALVGGVGYERLRLTQDAPLLDAAGALVVDGAGRLVSDTAQPRQLAFETDGLIWDAGVLWRPNRRTSVEGRVGRRYGSTTYTGSISYRASEDTAFVAALYDNFSTAGRSFTGALVGLPTDFEAVRNPLDGSFGGCVFGGNGGNCLNNNLANLTGFGFRNRGLVASLGTRRGGWNFGLGAGYDRRTYEVGAIAGLAQFDGLTDENLFAFLSASRPLDESTQFAGSLYLNHFDSALPGDFDSLSYGANAALSRNLWRRLSATAAVGVNVLDPDNFDERVLASALLGLRYGF